MDHQQAKAIIADQLGVGVELVVDNADFASDLGADSLDLIELTMRFEDALDIALGDEETANCASVSEALELLDIKLALAGKSKGTWSLLG